MNHTIEFKETTSEPMTSTSPWETAAKSKYMDLILKPEFEARRIKFPLGTTWMRVVPALRGSDRGWMLGVHALQYGKGRHAHPKTITPGTKSTFDQAFAWLNKNQNSALYSKGNKGGYRLHTDPLCLCWVLVEEEGKLVARLLLASGYDGSRGGSPGLGRSIWKLPQEIDEDGNLIGNPIDPVAGAQICVEKRQATGAQYPSYTVRMGRVPAPIDEMIARMEPEEVAALTPLEQVVHLPTEAEEWQLLEHVVDSDTIRKIRDSVE
jgi:hypothetical protein